MTRLSLTRLLPATLLLGALAATAGAQRAPATATTYTAAGARTAGSAAVAPLDSAIGQLEGFLQRYPDSAFRPNALFELGELLVRCADERFAEQQRPDTQAAGPAAGATSAAVGPDYAPAIARYEE